MSYDINFWLPSSGLNFDDWFESFEGVYTPAERLIISKAAQPIHEKLRRLLGEELVEDEFNCSYEDDDTGISFDFSLDCIVVSCPYRLGRGHEILPLMYAIAGCVMVTGDIEARDPQTGKIASSDNLALAIETFEDGARFSRKVISTVNP
ncbi:hypothetical protein D2E98_25610 [Mycobacteroides abscessus]|uniref:hypothetical protein n=1 Tax=Mycobacteroides abscessus TaxID=36809 RepID=UPI000D3EAFF6|nr:hypothetical protein [Mycobacteroides abscessus]PVA87871.1 hypothetical protein DDJ47_16335 [Mycobacteroides abscessus]RIT33785.1 hypothetical protein D2E98_25610 [Mycobacteroides abscessus]